MRDNEFQGQVAIVTGAGSGIGAACAQLFSAGGASVVVADVHPDAAQKVAADLPGPAVGVAVDVADPAACDRMVQRTVEEFGGLHIAVNNAGIGGPQVPTGTYPVDGWNQVLAVNLSGVFHCMRAEIPAMLAHGGGSIVNMASILGSVGFANACAYVAAKHGILGLTRTAALEYAAQGIRVNSVGPGFIDTPLLGALDPQMLAMVEQLHPLGRLGRSEEVAETVAFLASGRSANTTGTYLLTDGGYTAR